MMALTKQKLKQITTGIFVVLSLFVSSVSACACSHHSHPEKVQVEKPSCHEQAHTEEAGSQPVATDSADAACECILQPPARVFVKSEKLKIEKHAIASTSGNDGLAPLLTGRVYRSAEFYSPRIFLTEPFHNLSPGRAPPRL